MIVVDASVLTDYLLGRTPAVTALGSEYTVLHAPDVIELETLNALRRLLRGGVITVRRATGAIVDLGAVRLIRHPHSVLRDRVWELRDQLSPYDAAYLALAEALSDPIVLTADAGLAQRARASLGDDRVTLVG